MCVSTFLYSNALGNKIIYKKPTTQNYVITKYGGLMTLIILIIFLACFPKPSEIHEGWFKRQYIKIRWKILRLIVRNRWNEDSLKEMGV
jgi:hypothetical protein